MTMAQSQRNMSMTPLVTLRMKQTQALIILGSTVANIQTKKADLFTLEIDTTIVKQVDL